MTALQKTVTSLQKAADATQPCIIAKELRAAAKYLNTAADEIQTTADNVIKRPETEVFHLSKQRKSERIVWYKDGKKEFFTFKNPQLEPNVVSISPGEAILFRQDLPHAGCGYLDSNLRIHAAFDIKSMFFIIRLIIILNIKIYFKRYTNK